MMIELEYIAALLLLVRIVCVYFIMKVLKTQRELMKRPIDAEITGYRRTLFYLTLGLLGSNIVPIIFDTFIIFKESGIAWSDLSSTPFLIVYTVSNAFAALLAAFLISKIYSQAVAVDETHTQSDHTLMND